METYQIILIVLGVLLIGVGLFFLLRKRQPKSKNYELEGILNLLDRSNINKVDFIRNKIVLNFNDVTLFDTEQLHEKGALGINIVGDKVKFYLDGGNEVNENIYKEIKKYLEG